MKYLCFAILSGLCLAKPLHAQTLQDVTNNGNSTTSINAGSITPATPQAGVMSGSLKVQASPLGPAMSLGVVNTDNTSTHWGWLQTAYANNPGVYGKLALNPLGGNVGIGTSTPGEKLSVVTGNQPGLGLFGNSNSYAGADILIRRLNAYSSVGRGPNIQFGDDASGLLSMVQSYQGQLQFFNSNNNSWFEVMRLTGNGYVGIGTQSPDQKLTVDGTVHSSAVIVDNHIPHPDYVFKNDYNLLPLNKVESYIQANHHLPEIPSAAEVEKKGLNLGEMNTLLLKKLEELTLYLIDNAKRDEQK